MNEDIAISLTNLSKKYLLYDSPKHRLKEALHPFRKKYHRDFYALKDINLEVRRGETFGIIGRNGSGKSTLLKIITGVLTPSSGSVELNGVVTALLELGGGFNPEFSGIENIYFNGSIMGFSKSQMDEKLDDILSFADIGDFVYQPVKMYSSGMFVRLAFALSVSVDPDILVVDEALSVGDTFFQAKSMVKIKKMIDNEGTTLLFVSHDTGTIKSLCKKGILLDKGTIIYNGDASVAVEKYFGMKVESEQKIVKNRTTVQPEDNKALNDCFNDNEEFEKRASFQRVQNGKASFKYVALLDENGNEIESVEYGQKVTLRMAVEVHEDIHLLGYGYHIRDENGVDMIYSDCFIEGKNCLENLEAGDKYIIDWCFNARVRHGKYSIASVISIPIDVEIGHVDFCDYIPISCQFVMDVRRPARLYGLVNWDNDLIIRRL
jgi:lipopolysaccharide transport system ATP-binding protein